MTYSPFESINPQPGDSNVVMDIELSNRCNAQCHFCPRSALPSLGHMTQETFTTCIQRVKEAGIKTISFAGRGESMQNPRFADFVQQAHKEDLHAIVVTNGSHFNSHNTTNFHKWGIKQVTISMSDFGEAYEQVYKLPFKQTMDKIRKFIKYNAKRMDIVIVIVDHGNNSPPIRQQQEYWTSLGVNSIIHNKITRAGSASYGDNIYFDRSKKSSEEIMDIILSSDTPPVC